MFKARGAAERGIVAIDVCTRTAIGRFADSATFTFTILGWSAAKPQDPLSKATKARGAADSIKPGVERSETPGTVIESD